MVLVDTSVWIEHFRVGEPVLAELLIQTGVVTHPFVIGELACGNLKSRSAILAHLGMLPGAKIASHPEVFQMIEDRRLWGKGIGWADAHLLASALLTNCRFWTFDKRLQQIARDAGLAQHR